MAYCNYFSIMLKYDLVPIMPPIIFLGMASPIPHKKIARMVWLMKIVTTILPG
jgi:hypothetical protein